MSDLVQMRFCNKPCNNSGMKNRKICAQTEHISQFTQMKNNTKKNQRQFCSTRNKKAGVDVFDQMKRNYSVNAASSRHCRNCPLDFVRKSSDGTLLEAGKI